MSFGSTESAVQELGELRSDIVWRLAAPFVVGPKDEVAQIPVYDLWAFVRPLRNFVLEVADLKADFIKARLELGGRILDLVLVEDQRDFGSALANLALGRLNLAVTWRLK